MDKKNSYDLYSEQSEDDGPDSCEGEPSDELISSDDDEVDIRRDTEKVEEVKASHVKAMPAGAVSTSRNNILITSSEAIGSSIIKSIPVDSGWQNRRSESEVVLSRIKRKSQRSLLKRPSRRRRTTAARSPEEDAPRGGTGGEAVRRRCRTKLRLMAAPVAVNKRKKQMSLKSMFKK